MSYDQGSFTSGSDNYSNRTEGFNDNSADVNSYGSGPGSGASDPANTGLGGYNSNQQGGSGANDTYTGTGGGFSNSGSNFDNNQRDEGFSDGNQSSGGLGSGTYGSGPAAGASDPANTGLGGYSGNQGQNSGNPNSSSYGGTDDLNTQLDQTYQEGQRDRNDAYGGETRSEQQGNKPSVGDKLTGAAQQLAGSMTGNQGLKERGEERKTGDYN